MKTLILWLVTAISFSANAEWVRGTIKNEVKASSTLEIAAYLQDAEDLFKFLASLGLASGEPIKALEIYFQTAEYNWKNDDECQVPDPSKIKPILLTHSSAQFVYTKNPEDIWYVSIAWGKADPCSGDKTLNSKPSIKIDRLKKP